MSYGRSRNNEKTPQGYARAFRASATGLLSIALAGQLQFRADNGTLPCPKSVLCKRYPPLLALLRCRRRRRLTLLHQPLGTYDIYCRLPLSFSKRLALLVKSLVTD
jgi:hypothetical protein